MIWEKGEPKTKIKVKQRKEKAKNGLKRVLIFAKKQRKAVNQKTRKLKRKAKKPDRDRVKRRQEKKRANKK